MKSFIALLSLIAFCSCDKRYTSFQPGYLGLEYPATCIDDQQVVQAFRTAYNDFSVKLFKRTAPWGNYFFILSPHAVWTTLAAVAEGADYVTQKELFQFLELPDDACSREKYYKIATTRLFPSYGYVNVVYNKVLLINKDAKIDPKWNNFIRKQSLLDVISAPVKSDPATTSDIVTQIISSDAHKLDLSGNSVLLNSIDFNGLWTTAFSDAVIQRSPFYNPAGQRIGSVDLMRVKRRVRIGYVPKLKAKVIELPIGINEEYSLIFVMVQGFDPSKSSAGMSTNSHSLFDLLPALQDSEQSIEVAIPRMVINSEINLRYILEDFGIVNLWKNPGATRFISTPSAHPSSYIQRVSITLNNTGINPPPGEVLGHVGVKDIYRSEFVADRPFIFGLLDRESYTCLMAAMYTQPTYPY